MVAAALRRAPAPRKAGVVRRVVSRSHLSGPVFLSVPHRRLLSGPAPLPLEFVLACPALGAARRFVRRMNKSLTVRTGAALLQLGARAGSLLRMRRLGALDGLPAVLELELESVDGAAASPGSEGAAESGS